MSNILKYNRTMNFGKYAPELVGNLKTKKVELREWIKYESNICCYCHKDLEKKYTWDNKISCPSCDELIQRRKWTNSRKSNTWAKVELILKEVNGLYLDTQEQKDLLNIFIKSFGYKDKKNTNRLPTFNVINKALEFEGHNYRFARQFKQIKGKRIAWLTCLDVVFEEKELKNAMNEEG